MLCIFTNNSFISFSKHFSAKLSITIKRKIKKKCITLWFLNYSLNKGTTTRVRQYQAPA